MSKIKYVAIASVLSFGLTACTNNNRDSATLGSTQDTTNVNNAGTSAGKDTAKSSGTDSTSHGNADPSGRMTKDSTKWN